MTPAVRPCAYCAAPGTTRDHILPRAWMPRDYQSDSIANIRPACQRCNNLRGLLFHCPAMLACFRTIQAATGESDRQTHERLGTCGQRHHRRMLRLAADVVASIPLRRFSAGNPPATLGDLLRQSLSTRTAPGQPPGDHAKASNP